MVLTYSKTVWQDRLVEFPNRYNKSGEAAGQVTLTPNPGTVTQAGTPISAVNLNKIEQGIADIHDLIRRNATTNQLEYFDGTRWRNVGGVMVASNTVQISQPTEYALSGGANDKLVFKFVPPALGECEISFDAVPGAGDATAEIRAVSYSEGWSASDTASPNSPTFTSNRGMTLTYKTPLGTSIPSSSLSSTSYGRKLIQPTDTGSYKTYTGVLNVEVLTPIYLILIGTGSGSTGTKVKNIVVKYDIL